MGDLAGDTIWGVSVLTYCDTDEIAKGVEYK